MSIPQCNKRGHVSIPIDDQAQTEVRRVSELRDSEMREGLLMELCGPSVNKRQLIGG
jgi:hypothetical protein